MATPTKQLTWLITGCSSGLGADLATEALRRGDKVIATARNGPARLGALQQAGAQVLDLDVTWPPEKINAVVRPAIEASGGLDVLVNNAGALQLGILEEMPLEDLQGSLDVMMMGAVKMMRAVLPHFRERKAGQIVYISSLFAWSGMAATAPYCAAKYAIEGIVECADFELKPFGISNLLLELGWFRTDMAATHNARLATGSIGAYDELRKGANAGVAGVNGNQPGDPKKAVARIADIIRREGVAKGYTDLPLRIPMAPDGFDTVRKKCQDTLKICDEWEASLNDTNF